MTIFPVGTQVRVLHHPHAEVGQVYTIAEPGLANGGYARQANGVDWHHFSPGEVKVVSQLGTGKTRILIYAWDGASSGYSWSPVDRDPGGRLAVTREYKSGKQHRVIAGEIGILSEVWLAGYAPDDAGRERINNLIENDLQDAITRGLIGRIIDRY